MKNVYNSILSLKIQPKFQTETEKYNFLSGLQYNIRIDRVGYESKFLLAESGRIHQKMALDG